MLSRRRQPRVAHLAASAIGVAWFFVLALRPSGAGPIVRPVDEAGFFGSTAIRNLPEISNARESFRDRRYDDCLRQLTQAHTQSPDSLPPARIVFAWMFQAERQLVQAQATLEQAVIDHPEHPCAYMTFGQLAMADGRLTDAQLQFEKARSLDVPGNWSTALKRYLHESVLDGLAAIAERRADWSQAENFLDELIRSTDRKAAVRVRLSRAWFFLGDQQKCLEGLRRSSQEDRELDPPEITMAALCMAKGDNDATTEWLQEALKLYPRDARPWRSLAEWELALGNPDKADVCAANAAELGLKPSYEFQTLRGQVALELGRYADAETFLDAVNRSVPADIHAGNQLILALAEQSDPQKRKRALQLAEINMRQYPRDAEVLATLGRVQFRLDRIADAERTLRLVVASARFSADAAYYLACVHDRRGRIDEARRMLAAAFEGSPGRFTFRRQARILRDRLAADRNSVRP